MDAGRLRTPRDTRGDGDRKNRDGMMTVTAQNRYIHCSFVGLTGLGLFRVTTLNVKPKWVANPLKIIKDL